MVKSAASMAIGDGMAPAPVMLGRRSRIKRRLHSDPFSTNPRPHCYNRHHTHQQVSQTLRQVSAQGWSQLSGR